MSDTDQTDITIGDRLRNARVKAGFASAAEAARQHGWGIASYRHHENGTRSVGIDQAMTYANAFEVSASWLLNLGGPAEIARVPIAKFYTAVYAHNLGEDSEIYRLIDGLHTRLGIVMVPEISISSDEYSWLKSANGLPPMHFIDPSDLDVPIDTIVEGYVFVYRVGSRAPSSILATGDIVFIDSSVGEAQKVPALFLLRDEAGPYIKIIQRGASGETLLLPDRVGEPALSAHEYARFEIVGKIIRMSQAL